MPRSFRLLFVPLLLILVLGLLLVQLVQDAIVDGVAVTLEVLDELFLIRIVAGQLIGIRHGPRSPLRGTISSRRPLADRRLEREPGVPGKEYPGVLRDLGDE